MRKNIVIIGAGAGGLCSAIRLAQKGFSVKILEARSESGGLASGLTLDGFSFDAGPYILLDKPGLQWAFEQLEMDINQTLSLTAIEHIYEVNQPDGTCIRFDASLDNTAQQFEQIFPGAGSLYKKFVDATYHTYTQLKPLTFKSHPGPIDLLLNGAITQAPFILQSLGKILQRSHLPTAIQKAIAIWTYVSGQPIQQAPSPMAFVPALMHNIGAYYVKGGMQSITKAFTKKAIESGVEIYYNTKVKNIKVDHKRAIGVETVNGEFIAADAVISNAAGVGTYTELLSDFNNKQKQKLERLPLQSPGVCIYLAVQGKCPPYYIRFKQNEKDCVAFVQPGVMDETIQQNGWYPARLIAPLSHEEASVLTEEKQIAFMQKLLDEKWWQQGISDYKVLHYRTTLEWGSTYNLYKGSMNPVMTAAFMRKGRLAHRSPYAKGLYLTGSATHPGQWVSFCSVSGVLAADCVANDF